MRNWRRICSMASVLCILLLVMLALPSDVLAAVADSTRGGYLAGYENTDPKPSTMSWWSTLAYIISLLIVFAFVVVMAYFVSRFLSTRFGVSSTVAGGRILENLPLGPNRSVCVVEIAGKYLMLGVSEGSISLLAEINDPAEIERLKKIANEHPIGTMAIAQQITSIQDLVRKVPEMIKDEYARRK